MLHSGTDEHRLVRVQLLDPGGPDDIAVLYAQNVVLHHGAPQTPAPAQPTGRHQLVVRQIVADQAQEREGSDRITPLVDGDGCEGSHCSNWRVGC